MADPSPSIKWRKAGVDADLSLTVDVDGPAGIDDTVWAEAVAFVAGVRNREAGGGDWGEIAFDADSGAIRVEGVGEGAEEALKAELESLISSAHTAAMREQDASDDDGDSQARAEAMQERFRKA